MPLRLAPLLRHLRRLAAPPAPAPEPDHALLARYARDQDEAAFAALVARHGPMVLRLCRRLLADAHAAEDCFQATFLILARRAGSVRRPEALAAWLHAVALRAALKARAGRRPQGLQNDGADLPDPRPDPLSEVTARELLAAVDEEVGRLPHAYRAPVILCCLEGLSQEEAAQRLGCTPAAVRGRLERGRKRLHERLANRGLTLPAALAAVELSRGAAGAGLPAALAATAVRAGLAASVGAGEGGMSEATALAEGSLSAASRLKLKLVAALALALSAAAWGAGVLTPPRPAEPPQAEGKRPAAPEAAGGKRPAADLHGDPLPDGAIARLGTLRFRGVRGCLAFSPDGKQLAAATEPAGATITLYDTATGRAGRRLTTRATLTRVVFAPDGQRLACADNSSGAHVFDAGSGKELFSVRGSHAAFADGGKTLVTADGYGDAPRVRVWGAATGQPLRQWPTSKTQKKDDPFGQGAEGMAVAAAAPVFALSDRADASTVQIRDLSSGATVCSVRLPAEGRSWLALAADGKTLATASPTSVRLWDAATGKEIRSWRQRADGPPVFAPDGKRLAWTGYDERTGIARLWTVARDGAAPQAVGEPVNKMEPPCFAPDGKVLAVVTDGHAVQLRRIADGKDVSPFAAHDGPIYRLAFTADGRHVVSGARDGWLTWEALTGRLLRRAAFGVEGKGEYVVAMLPDGRLLTADRTREPTQGVFRVREPLTGRELLRIEGRPDVGEVAVAPGGRYAALSGRDGACSVLDLRTGRWRYRGDPREAHFGPKLSADGAVLAWHPGVVGPFEVRVHREATGKTLAVKGLPDGPEVDRWLRQYPYVSPEGRWLVLPGGDGRLRRWDLLSGKEGSPLAGAQRTVWGVFWSPDGRLLLTRGSASPANVIDHEARRDVRAWDAATGRRLPHLELPDYPECILFSPDGRTLLTAGREEIRLREVATGQERGRLRGHAAAWVYTLAVSEDGRLLASGGDDSQVLVWDLTGRAPDGRWRTGRQRPEESAAAWEALAGADARAAYAALWRLASDPEGTTALLRERLRPAPAADAARVGRLVVELNSGKFAVRDRAEAELGRLGEAAGPALRKALERRPAEELRRRVLKLIERLEAVPTAERLQEVRAVEVLERIGTAESRGVLKGLAGGAPGARLTHEAQAALERLTRRGATP